MSKSFGRVRNYAAPELLNDRGGQYAGPEIDVWSMGCILYGKKYVEIVTIILDFELYFWVAFLYFSKEVSYIVMTLSFKTKILQFLSQWVKL